MGNAPQLGREEGLPEASIAARAAAQVNGRLTSALAAVLTASRLTPVAYSVADQALAVGGGFLANVALARTRSKEEYGMFVLWYSVFTFVSGLHNASILEPFTVYGSGRYRGRLSEYLWLMTRGNLLFGLLVSGGILLACVVLSWAAPGLISRALVGLGLTAGVLLSGIFLRRAFYVQHEPAMAAKSSLVFFVTVVFGLGLTLKLRLLDSLWVFLVLALGWTAAGTSFGRKLAFGRTQGAFLEGEPRYWREHWNYSKWVLATAFVFQLTTQGYYWLVAGFVSAKEVGELRAMQLLIGPLDQAFIALSFLVVPVLAAHYAAKRMGSFISLWRRFALAAAGSTALFALTIRLVGRPVMHVVYAGKYDGLAPFLFVLALLPLVTWVGSTMAQALNAVEKPRFVFWAYVSSGAATFLVGIPLVVRFGLRGAVFGMLLSGATYTLALGIGFWSAVYKAQMQLAGLRVSSMGVNKKL